MYSLARFLAFTSMAVSGLCWVHPGRATELVPQKSGVAQKSGPAQKACEMRWEWITKTCTRTVYENVTETREKTVYDTHYDTQTVQDAHRIAETHYRQEDFSYQVPYYETVTHEVPYTVNRPIYETRSRDVNYISYTSVPETRTRHVPYTTYHTVEETRTRSVPYTVPRVVPYTKTIDIHTGCWETHIEEHPGPVIQKCAQESGCWQWDPCRCCCVFIPGKCHTVEVQCPPVKVCKRVWVPRVEQKVVECTKVVYDTHMQQVPYTVSRLVPETHSREETYTINRLVPVTNTHTVFYQVAKFVPEQHTRTVTQLVKRMTTETGTRTVPYTVWNEVPSERTVTIPRIVPRTVTYTVTKCVPHTETYEVKVCVCRPVSSAVDATQKLDLPETQSGTVAESAQTPTDDVTLTSLDPQLPADAATPVDPQQQYRAGLEKYYRGDFPAALIAFELASELDQANAKYAYFWALAAYQSGDREEAERAVTFAIGREKNAPISNWGTVMERVQGSARLWLEKSRQDAKTAANRS
ncbi:MAG: tetratricopeptide repeat protein [Planctomycetaceae bacterium]|nr:tetratricopeptide repeat protein [Planctomycetales bacterium]MCB9921626.1 tetratricopeptide repeat protein [Planctomycetaceae bacterium]